ncbi:hypothetical protein SH661x_002006 [Planctomicrobium sp. SH661]|uniref:hypothetical protein n=1 Tax=Planctomicrobium sp. SH661 TaxID=3448124 RepID=UPI003F5B7BFA
MKIQFKPFIAIQFQQVDRQGKATDLPPLTLELPANWEQVLGPQLTQTVTQVQSQLQADLDRKRSLWSRLFRKST